MATKKISIAYATCLVLLITVSSYATTVQRLGLEDLVKKARTIVVGKLAGSRTYWSADARISSSVAVGSKL